MKYEKEYHIDVDIIIDKFVLKYPNLRPPTRESIAKLINTFPQILSDWKFRRTPKFVYFLFALLEFGDVPLKKFVKRNEQGKCIVDIKLFIEEINKNRPKHIKIKRKDIVEKTGYSAILLTRWKNPKNPKSPNLAYKILLLEELAEDDFTTFIVEKKTNKLK